MNVRSTPRTLMALPLAPLGEAAAAGGTRAAAAAGELRRLGTQRAPG